MIPFSQRLAGHPTFAKAVMAVILFNAVLMGVETNRELYTAHKATFDGLNWTIQGIFVIEILIRIVACFPKPLKFFRDGWNVFDFVVVSISLLPMGGPMANVVRLARVLRVVRLVSVSPDLKLIVNTMLRSIPSLGNVGMLIGILMYVYAILGFYKFGEIDPQNWGSLARAFQSCFVMLTLEGWVDLQRRVSESAPWAWLYFSSFIIVAVFVVVNLFIAVVLNNMDKARHEELRSRSTGTPEDQIREAIQDIKDQIERLEALAEKIGAPKS